MSLRKVKRQLNNTINLVSTNKQFTKMRQTLCIDFLQFGHNTTYFGAEGVDLQKFQNILSSKNTKEY